MAYGKPQMRPQKSSKPIHASPQPLTTKIQQGQVATKGASDFAQPDLGQMPASGNFQPNAGGPSSKGGSAKGSNVGSSHAKEGPTVTHVSLKKPVHPGSHGGSNTGSVDTMTKRIFHPMGGLGNKAPAGRKSPQAAGGYKDSGTKGGTQKVGVSK